jgi:hypothetical protein
MNESDKLARHIKLNRQALQLLNEEPQQKRARGVLTIERSQLRLLLIKVQGRLEQQQAEPFDSCISRQLDAIEVLLEATGGDK